MKTRGVATRLIRRAGSTPNPGLLPSNDKRRSRPGWYYTTNATLSPYGRTAGRFRSLPQVRYCPTSRRLDLVPAMTQHQRSHGRFLPTYPTRVGLRALALFAIPYVGYAVVTEDRTLTRVSGLAPGGA